MKITVFIIMFLVLPAIDFAQTKADYIDVMDKYTKYYNRWLPDSLTKMLFKGWPEEKTEWISNFAKKKQKYGEIKSYKFIALDTFPHRIAVFKVTYDTAAYIMGINFDEKKKPGMHWLDASPRYYDSLLKKY